MRVECPNCSEVVTSEPGELAACAVCGHWWIAEEPVAGAEPAVKAEAPADVEPRLPPRERGPVAPLPRPAPTPEDSPWEFELQLGVGDKIQGPHDRMFLREGLYVGRLTGEERIRVPGGSSWERLGDRAEFAEIMALLAKEESAPRGSTRIAGWQRSAADDDAQKTQPQPAKPSPAPVAAAAAAAAAAMPNARRLPLLIALALVISAVLGAVGYVVFG